MVKATFDALLQLRSAVTVAKQRGILWIKYLKDNSEQYGKDQSNKGKAVTSNVLKTRKERLKPLALKESVRL